MYMLDKLIAGEKLWDIHAADVQVEMRQVREQIAIEHEEHLADDSACLIDTGVLLGALNLINGLLRKDRPISVRRLEKFLEVNSSLCLDSREERQILIAKLVQHLRNQRSR
jgi:hypothetical protein